MKGENTSDTTKAKALNKTVVRRSFFGAKYIYLDEKTRVRYGFTFAHSGKTYTLQRKSIFWNEVAWTYPSTHIGQQLSDIIQYLKWYEQDKNKPKTECLF